MSRAAWRQRGWQAALLVALLVATAGFLRPPPEGPGPEPPFPHFDKLLHAGVFAVLGLLAPFAYPRVPRWGVFASLVFYGACIELAQLRVGRTADALDLAADAVGALIAFVRLSRRTA